MVSPLQFTEIAVRGMMIHTFEMPDRRPGASSSEPTRWLFQMQLEMLLYQNSKFGEKSTGAMYRLLQRTPEAKGRPLLLGNRAKAIGAGLGGRSKTP